MSIILGLRRLRKEGCVAYLGYTVRSYAPPAKDVNFPCAEKLQTSFLALNNICNKLLLAIVTLLCYRTLDSIPSIYPILVSII